MQFLFKKKKKKLYFLTQYLYVNLFELANVEATIDFT